MKILTVVGNRPQFIKAAAVSGLLRSAHEEVLVHTGQHYDERALGGLLRRAGPRATGSRTRHRGRLEHVPDGAHAGGAGAAAGDRAAGRGAGLRRYQLDARRRSCGSAGGHTGGARRGRDAFVRPRDAGGAQPGPDRPSLRAAAVRLADRRAEPARGVDRGSRRGRRRRDGRRGPAPAARRTRGRRDAAGT